MPEARPSPATKPPYRILVTSAALRDPVAAAQALGLGPRRLGSTLALGELRRESLIACVEGPEGLAIWIPDGRDFDPSEVRAELELRRAGLDASQRAKLDGLLGRELPDEDTLSATELLPVDYARDADPKARTPATPDPAGEGRLFGRMLVFLVAVLGALGYLAWRYLG